MFWFKSGIFLLVILFTAACGKLGNSAGGGSGISSLERKPFGTCDRKSISTINLCMEAVGPDYDEPGYLGILQSSCESSGGTFSTSTCDPTGSLGICIVAAGRSNMTYISYYPPQYTAASAQSTCASNGGIWFNQ